MMLMTATLALAAIAAASLSARKTAAIPLASRVEDTRAKDVHRHG
jgi:hypothetical protein